jgi:hypothetical protein
VHHAADIGRVLDIEGLVEPVLAAEDLDHLGRGLLARGKLGGSPGTARASRKTTTVIPNTVGTTNNSRRAA